MKEYYLENYKNKISQWSESILKKDIKTNIINILHNDLGICIGLKINPLYNFTLHNFTFIIHNKFSISLFYNKKNELVTKIKEDEKIKMISEAITGCYIDFIEIKIKEATLIAFHGLVAGLEFYNKIAKELTNKESIELFNTTLNKYTTIINKFKKNNSYFIFDITNE